MDTLKNATILAIDDDPQVLLLLNILLVKKCAELILQTDPVIGLDLARDKLPNLILLDIMIGNIDGYEVCKQLKADKKTQGIPVIFLSALSLPADKVRGFEVGGVDYISKPFDIAEVVARIESCLITHQKIYQISNNHSQSPKIAEVMRKYQFNKREIEILRLYISGFKRSEIGAKIYLSENTVKWYLKQIFQKLEVDNRAALMEKMREFEF